VSRKTYNAAQEDLMPEWTPLTHLQEAFRKQLFRLIDQYLSFPDEATHGRIIRTLVMYQQARMVLESEANNTLLMQRGRVSMAAEAKPGQARKGKTYTRALRLKEKSVLSMADTSLTKSESAWRSRS
jgi:hypothetical protein